MSNDDYEVGYKKPPGSTKYKKGTSGNPRGRPKKNQNPESEDRAQVHEDEMNELISTLDKNGKEKKISARRLMYKKLKQLALQKGDMIALKTLIALEKELAIPTPVESKRRGGVLVVPAKVSPAEWVEQARKTRDKMLETDGNEKA